MSSYAHRILAGRPVAKTPVMRAHFGGSKQEYVIISVVPVEPIGGMSID
jgi:hypothetical protein